MPAFPIGSARPDDPVEGIAEREALAKMRQDLQEIIDAPITGAGSIKQSVTSDSADSQDHPMLNETSKSRISLDRERLDQVLTTNPTSSRMRRTIRAVESSCGRISAAMMQFLEPSAGSRPM